MALYEMSAFFPTSTYFDMSSPGKNAFSLLYRVLQTLAPKLRHNVVIALGITYSILSLWLRSLMNLDSAVGESRLVPKNAIFTMWYQPQVSYFAVTKWVSITP